MQGLLRVFGVSMCIWHVGMKRDIAIGPPRRRQRKLKTSREPLRP